MLFHISFTREEEQQHLAVSTVPGVQHTQEYLPNYTVFQKTWKFSLAKFEMKFEMKEKQMFVEIAIANPKISGTFKIVNLTCTPLFPLLIRKTPCQLLAV